MAMMEEPKPVVVFAPHPDDDILACGGTIALKVRGGQRVHVVYMTDGRNSHSHVLGIETDPSPQEVKEIRRMEAMGAAAELGIDDSDRLIFLDFEDGALESHVEVATEKTAILLRQLNAAEVFYPGRGDSHPDHRATYAIVTSALEQTLLSPAKFIYLVWPPEGVEQEVPTHQIRVDVAKVLDLKRRAIGAHRSQIEILFPTQRRPVLDEKFVEGFLVGYEDFDKVA